MTSVLREVNFGSCRAMARLHRAIKSAHYLYNAMIHIS